MKISNFKHKYKLIDKPERSIDNLINAVRDDLKTFEEEANRFY